MAKRLFLTVWPSAVRRSLPVRQAGEDLKKSLFAMCAGHYPQLINRLLIYPHCCLFRFSTIMALLLCWIRKNCGANACSK